MNLLDPSSLGWWYYPLSFFLNLFDSFIAPLPQELFVLAIGPLSKTHALNFWWAFAVAWLANILGDVLLAWTISRYRHVLERWRWGRWLLKKSAQGEEALGNRGTFSVLMGLRFVSGGRTASYTAAGLANVPMKLVWGSTVVGSFLWVAFMVVLGQATADITNLPAWASALLGMLVGTLIGAVPAVIAWARRRKAKGSQDERTGPSGERAAAES